MKRVPCIYAPMCTQPGARVIYTRPDGTPVCKCEACYQRDIAEPWGGVERDIGTERKARR